MDPQTIAEYLRRASEARIQAELAIEAGDKVRWLRIAAAWETLAGSGSLPGNDNHPHFPSELKNGQRSH